MIKYFGDPSHFSAPRRCSSYSIILCKIPLTLYGIAGSTAKPEDMYRIVEHFALGRRRLELFGEDHNIRSGWLTVGKGLSSSNFDAKVRALSVLQWEEKKGISA